MSQLQTILRFMPKKLENRMLSQLPYTPAVSPPGVELPYKYHKANLEMMGPERIHNQLIYKQYGIIAIGGGALKGAHFDVIRDRINKYVDFERFFAVWRIDPPYKPKSKKSLGKKMGGGKGKVHHYETPIKPGRVLVELAGVGQFEEIEACLDTVTKKLPIYAIPITQEKMDALKAEKLKLDEENYNPFKYRDLVQRNFSNSAYFLSPREALWGGDYSV